MRKEKVEIYCDICGHKILNQSSFPYPTIWKCKICKGTGKVKGERIDSPNRPEPCPKCQL